MFTRLFVVAIAIALCSAAGCTRIVSTPVVPDSAEQSSRRSFPRYAGNEARRIQLNNAKRMLELFKKDGDQESRDEAAKWLNEILGDKGIDDPEITAEAKKLLAEIEAKK